MLDLILVAAVAGLGSALLTAGARGYALRRHLIDHPGQRRSHHAPTPRGGGVGIAAVMVVTALWLTGRVPGEARVLLAFALGLAVVAGVGAIDDHRSLSARLRLAMHVLASTPLVWLLFPPQNVAGWVAFAAGLLFLVGLINVWNFMDGIDGLAASQAALVAVALLAVLPLGSSGSVFAAALAAACIGFLPFNLPRARIFLGDVGSGALGFALGGGLLAAIAGGQIDPVLALVPISAFGLDAGLTLVKRMGQGRRWWQPHREHLYQWLVRCGWSHPRTTLGYALWTGSAVVLTVVLQPTSPESRYALTIVWLALGAGLWYIVRQRLRTGAKGRQG